MKGLIVGGGIIVALGLAVGLMCINWYNTSVTLENGIKAQWTDNQNSYSAFSTRVIESAGITKKYTEDFKQVLRDTMEGRYGKGADKVTAFIAEHNPTPDSSVYANIQRMIESGRNDFQRSQTALRDRQRTYADHLQRVGGSILSGIFGFPKMVAGELAPPKDLDGDSKLTVLDYPVVTTALTQKVFATGTDQPIDPFAK